MWKCVYKNGGILKNIGIGSRIMYLRFKKYVSTNKTGEKNEHIPYTQCASKVSGMNQ